MGSTDADAGMGVGVDALGNVYTCGTFNGTVDFDPGVNTVNMSAGSYTSIFIQKSDADGNFIWAKRIICSTDMQVGEIQVDPAGNSYITGCFNSATNFDIGNSSYFISSVGEKDAFVAKYNTDGDLVWAKAIGGINDDIGRSVFVDNAGNTYSTGTFSGTIDADPGTGTYNLTNQGLGSGYVQKLDANGDFVWAIMNTRVGAGIQCFSIEADAQGNVYVGGAFSGTMNFNLAGSGFNLTAVGSYDIFVQKLDSDGNFVWAKRAGAENLDYCRSIALGEANDVYLTGFFNNTVDFDPGIGIANLASAGGNDSYVLKLDTAGNFKWAKKTGSTGSEMGERICYQSGTIYSVGSFYNTVDFNPNAGTVSYTATGTYPDAYIQQLDTSGNYVWSATFGDVQRDEAYGVHADGLENIYITGRYNGTVDFDPGPNTVNLTATTGTVGDVFVQKLTSIVISAEENKVHEFMLYPNPASTSIGIQSMVNNQWSLVSIYNTQGQLVLTTSNINNQTLNIENLIPGLYYLHLQSAEGVGVKKFEVIK